MEMVQTIRIIGREVKNDKQKFIACSTNIDGKWFKVKFNACVTDNPKTKGLYDLTFHLDDASIESGKPYTKNDGTTGRSPDVIWIKNIAALRKLSDEEMQELNRERMSEIFGK